MMSLNVQKVFDYCPFKVRKLFAVATLVLPVLILSGCSSPGTTNRFADPVQRKITDLQDRRKADSLVIYLSHENPSYRREAALALASVQDSVRALMLGNALLDDNNAGVRAAAAFALGQTGSFAAANALIPSLNDTDPIVRFEVRVAMGKTIRPPDFPALLGDRSADTAATRGTAWALFHLGTRRLADSAVVKRAVELLSSADEETLLGVVHFFARAVYPPHKDVQHMLIQTASTSNAEVRMAVMFALRKFINAESFGVISHAIGNDPDYRVRVNAVRSLQGFEWARTAEWYQKSLLDKNESVVVTAAEALRQRLPAPAQSQPWKGYTAEEVELLLRSCNSWRAAAVLTEILLTLDPSPARVGQVNLNVENPYQQAALIDALGKAPVAYPIIVEKLFTSGDKVVMSTAAGALADINRSSGFTPAMQKEFVGIYQRAIAGGDQGVILNICGALADSTLGYRDVIDDITFLKQAKEKLSLPRDFETLLPLERAIAWFERKPAPKPPVNSYNHPIDWTLAASIPFDQKLLIKTSRGDITIRLLINEAPGSVVNFVKLVESKYFDGKFVHRVVPNFVFQAGCHRGDGFGSEDYSIRSEFAMRQYKTGSVGMASAGKDTEGTQWFITHSPTPHLDGKYTIFAEVTDGQAVTDAMEVGDRIISASLVKN